MITPKYNDLTKTLTVTGTGQTFIAVKLELGSTQTLAHQDANGNWVLNDAPPNFQQELAKCQRFQYIIPAGDIPIGYAKKDTSAVRAQIPLPVPMRTLPGIPSNAVRMVYKNSGNATTTTVISLAPFSLSGALLMCVDSVTAMEEGVFGYLDASSGQIIFDANL